MQPSRVIGYTGPRWFLRATLAGRPALDPEYAARVRGGAARRRGAPGQRRDATRGGAAAADAPAGDSGSPTTRPRNDQGQTRLCSCRTRQGRLRAGLRQWASQTHAEAVELRGDAVKAGCVPIDEAPDREMVTVQGTPAHGDPAPARRRTGSRGRALRRHRHDHRAVARTPPDRGIFPGRSIRVTGRIGVHGGIRVDLQPALRPAVLSDARGPVTGTTTATVEEVVRGQLATALGGRRGMLEAAVPTAVFTVVFLPATSCGPRCWSRSAAPSCCWWCVWPSAAPPSSC